MTLTSLHERDTPYQTCTFSCLLQGSKQMGPTRPTSELKAVIRSVVLGAAVVSAHGLVISAPASAEVRGFYGRAHAADPP